MYLKNYIKVGINLLNFSNVSKYMSKEMSRGIFSNLSSICDGAFCENN